MTISDQKYLSLTTFKRDGTPKPTPIWVVEDTDGKPAFVTMSSSWKIKRIRNNPSVLLQPCGRKGVVTPGTKPIEATAILGTDSDFVRVRRLTKSKYGMGFRLISLFSKVMSVTGKGSGNDISVSFSLD